MSGLALPFAEAAIRILNNPQLLKTRAGSNTEGTRGTVYVLTGPDAPDMRKTMQNHVTVILPTGANPEFFDFTFLAAHTPIMVWCDSMDNALVNSIWAALERDGCDSASFGDGDWFPILKKAGGCK